MIAALIVHLLREEDPLLKLHPTPMDLSMHTIIKSIVKGTARSFDRFSSSAPGDSKLTAGKVTRVSEEVRDSVSSCNYINGLKMLPIRNFAHTARQVEASVIKIDDEDEDILKSIDVDQIVMEHYHSTCTPQPSVSKCPPIAPFNVHATLQQISKRLPRTKEELLDINGLGKAKVGKYGDRLLESLESIINDHYRTFKSEDLRAGKRRRDENISPNLVDDDDPDWTPSQPHKKAVKNK